MPSAECTCPLSDKSDHTKEDMKKTIPATISDILEYTRQSFENMNTTDLPSGKSLDAAICDIETVMSRIENMHESLTILKLSLSKSRPPGLAADLTEQNAA